MAIDERSRHELFLKLERVLGPGEATTLMQHLPPVGWADVATKHDLERELRLATESLRASFRGEIISLQRNIMFAMTGLVISVATLAFAAARLI